MVSYPLRSDIKVKNMFIKSRNTRKRLIQIIKTFISPTVNKSQDFMYFSSTFNFTATQHVVSYLMHENYKSFHPLLTFIRTTLLASYMQVQP